MRYKFRGKMADNVGWAYGYYARVLADESKEIDIIITKAGDYEVLPESVGQYVPREDFYEGDVLYGEDIDEFGNRIGRWYGTVKYDEDSGRIRIKEHFGDWYETDDFGYQEIIGNIHDNPELMEVE